SPIWRTTRYPPIETGAVRSREPASAAFRSTEPSAAGDSRKAPAWSWASSSASTQARTAGSSWQARARSAARSDGGASHTAWKTSRMRGYERLSERVVMRSPLAAQLREEPGAGHLPVQLDGARRDAQGRGRLLHRQPAEEPQLDDAALAFVEGLQTG